METLEQLFKKMWPKVIYFKSRDPRIKALLEDGNPNESLFINESSLNGYLNDIAEDTQEMLARFVDLLASNSKPTLFYNFVYSRVNSFLLEFKEFQLQVASDKKRISTFFESLEVLIDGYDYKNTGEFLFSELSAKQQHDLKKYMDVTLEQAEKILQQVNDLSTTFQDVSVQSKMKFNLPVSEIALLFRVLLENKTIETSTKEEMFRIISTVFESSRTDNISVNSLRKKYHDPDSSSIGEIDALLVNLRQTLRKISNK